MATLRGTTLVATLSAAVSCCTLLPACEGRREAAAPRRVRSPALKAGAARGGGKEVCRQAGQSLAPRAAAHALKCCLLCDLSKSGDSSKPSFPCLFSMDNRIRPRKKRVCVWHRASVQYMLVVTTRAGFLDLNILQLPKAQMGSTEAGRIYRSYPEILINKRLFLALWGHSLIQIAGQGWGWWLRKRECA